MSSEHPVDRRDFLKLATLTSLSPLVASSQLGAAHSAAKTRIAVGPGRDGPPKVRAFVPSVRVIAQLDWGDRLGIYDYTSDQGSFSWIRSPRLLVRGEAGEIDGHHVRLLKDFADDSHPCALRLANFSF